MSAEDKAQEQELMMWELNNRPKPEPARFVPQDPRYGPEYCEHCDAEMPEVRRSYGYTICVDCKSALEVKGRNTRH